MSQIVIVFEKLVINRKQYVRHKLFAYNSISDIINEKFYKISSLSIILTAIAKYAIGEAYTTESMFCIMYF